MIRLPPARLTLATWEYVLLFPRGEGQRLIWKPGLNWSPILDDFAAQSTVWQGARPADATERFDEWRATLPNEERQMRIAKTVAALKAQEET